MGSASAATHAHDLERVRRTVALLDRRGYALEPGRLAEVCWGGRLTEERVRTVVSAGQELEVEHGLVLGPLSRPRAAAIASRARAHESDARAYMPMTLDFVSALVAACPFILQVSIAGSLASGGFRESDDVDLNLVVEDGTRHLTYVAANVLGYVHAMRYRRKPVDSHTRRPLAPRLMTVNLVLERSQCFPLIRQDEDMAYEVLQSDPVFGTGFFRKLVRANPGLVRHFPQLAIKRGSVEVQPQRRAPGWLYPRLLDGPAELIGRAAWRYMQWTRRHRPEALARVAFVRETMRPYTLFPDSRT